MNGKTVNPIRRKIGVRLAVVILRLELGVVIVLSQLCFDLPNRLSHYVQSRIDDQCLSILLLAAVDVEEHGLAF